MEFGQQVQLKSSGNSFDSIKFCSKFVVVSECFIVPFWICTIGNAHGTALCSPYVVTIYSLILSKIRDIWSALNCSLHIQIHWFCLLRWLQYYFDVFSSFLIRSSKRWWMDKIKDLGRFLVFILSHCEMIYVNKPRALSFQWVRNALHFEVTLLSSFIVFVLTMVERMANLQSMHCFNFFYW